MATPITPNDEEIEFAEDEAAIARALSQARAELANLTDAASAAASASEAAKEEYSLHQVTGVGRYAIVRRTGWRPLLKVIQNRSANIDFSLTEYPSFDAIIGEKFASPHLLDPLDVSLNPFQDDYRSYQHLRDNIAAVRNFLMESYYVNTPPGMTPEKAKQTLEEIAAFVGEGLDNNYRFLGVIPNHKWNEPFISLDEAMKPNGDGAQYIYEKILEMHRQSSWLRPFAPIVSFFGGKVVPDWMLPPASETEFTDLFEHDIATEKKSGPSPATLESQIATVTMLEGKLNKARGQKEMANMAIDLDALGNYLLHTASNMQSVSTLAEPVRREAIDIAKDILRKLRVTLGDINVMQGLKLPASDDLATFGSLKGVALVYERLLSWSRSMDASIMQNPTVVTGVQAIGQLGYLAKLEALRYARMAGRGTLATTIRDQLATVPNIYSRATESKFGGLVEKVENGINTLMSREQTISGPGVKVGLGNKGLGGSASSIPTAGVAAQTSQAATNAANAARMNASIAAHATQIRNHVGHQEEAPAIRPPAPPAQQRVGRTPGAPGTTARTASSSSASSSTSRSSSSAAPVNPVQRQQQAMRGNYTTHHDEHEEHEQHERDLQRLQAEQRRLAAAKAKANAAKISAIKIDPHLLHEIHSAVNTKGLVGPAVNPSSKGNFVANIKTPKPNEVASPAAQTAATSNDVTNDPLKHPVPTMPLPPRGRGI